MITMITTEEIASALNIDYTKLTTQIIEEYMELDPDGIIDTRLTELCKEHYRETMRTLCEELN